MRLIAWVIVVAAGFGAATPVLAQDDPGAGEVDRLRRRILERVDSILKREIEQIRAEIAALIDQELGIGKAAASTPTPVHPPKLDPIRPPAHRDPAAGPVRPPAETDPARPPRPTAAEDIDDIDLTPPDLTRQLSESSRLFEKAMEAHMNGRYDESISGFKKIAESAPEGDQQATALYNVACGYALKGDKARALRWLRKSIEAGFSDAGHIEQDADFESLRGMPEFRELVEFARSSDEPDGE